jgi:hypothetical protein
LILIVGREVGGVVKVYHRMIFWMHVATLVNLQMQVGRRQWLDTPQSLLGNVMPGKSTDVGSQLRHTVLHKPTGSVVGLMEMEMAMGGISMHWVCHGMVA